MAGKRPRPEGSSATAPVDAGLWLRVGAKLIDDGLFAFIDTIAISFGAYLNALEHPAWVIGSGFVVTRVLWYIYVFEMTRRRGQTIGKMAANIQVVTPEGVPPGPWVMGRRLLVEFAFDMAGLIGMIVGWRLALVMGKSVVWGAMVGMGAGSLVGLINPGCILVSGRKQALHDRAAGTFVVRLGEERVRGFVLACVMAASVPFATTFGIIRPFFVEAYKVPSGSMEPTIEIGDRILANKLVRRLRPPRRHEIIMFKTEEWMDPKPKIFVKRVVGIPGDRLQVRAGKLYRNGKAVEEPYIMGPPLYTWPEDAEEGGEVVVEDGSVIVMGDNRNNSKDSHAWQRIAEDGRSVEPAPFVAIEAIRGKLVYRYWPPDRMGTVPQEEH